MQSDNHRLCETCGLTLAEGEIHGSEAQCIKGLRAAMVRQKQSAERIGMDMSIHFLRALEELSIHPDAGFRYTFWNNLQNKQEVLHPQQVSGIYASILKMYREQANFKPEEEQRKIDSHWSWVAGMLAGTLHRFMEKYEVEEEDKIEAQTLMERVARNDIEAPKPGELEADLKAERGARVTLEKLLRGIVAAHGTSVPLLRRDEIEAVLSDLDEQREARLGRDRSESDPS